MRSSESFELVLEPELVLELVASVPLASVGFCGAGFGFEGFGGAVLLEDALSSLVLAAVSGLVIGGCLLLAAGASWPSMAAALGKFQPNH